MILGRKLQQKGYVCIHALTTPFAKVRLWCSSTILNPHLWKRSMQFRWGNQAASVVVSPHARFTFAASRRTATATWRSGTPEKKPGEVFLVAADGVAILLMLVGWYLRIYGWSQSIHGFDEFDAWIYGVSTSHDSFFQTRKSPGLGGVLLGLLLKGLRRGGVRRREFGREFRRRGGVRRRLLRRRGLRRGGVRRGGLRGGALRLRLRLRKEGA